MTKHIVRVCRPRFEIVVLDVDAADDEAAKRQAIEQAEELSDDAWHLQTLDPTEYRPHVEVCYSEHTIDANAGSDAELRSEIVQDLRSLEPDEDTRYLLLLADIGSGEGRVIFQPWFRSDDPGLMEVDLTGDWLQRLTDVATEGIERFDPDDDPPRPLHPLLERLRPKTK